VTAGDDLLGSYLEHINRVPLQHSAGPRRNGYSRRDLAASVVIGAVLALYLGGWLLAMELLGR